MKTETSLDRSELTVSEFITGINMLRIKNKNNWYGGLYNVQGLQISIKGYNTWLQICKINGIHFDCTYNMTVKAFKDHLLNSINSYNRIYK